LSSGEHAFTPTDEALHRRLVGVGDWFGRRDAGDVHVGKSCLALWGADGQPSKSQLLAGALGGILGTPIEIDNDVNFAGVAPAETVRNLRIARDALAIPSVRQVWITPAGVEEAGLATT
jgi:hypothetical protein